MRYLPVEEEFGLSLCINKYGSPPINTISSRVVSTKSQKFSKPKACVLGPGASTILEHMNSGVVYESRMMNSPMTHPYDPALVPSWKVRRKVYEFSRLLPDTIKLELVLHGDIWPSLFDNHCLGKEDIGLYFFRSEIKRFERYIALVDYMCNKDLVMRTLFNDVELLILASTTLCSDSQRWNNEHFLWGLFYRMR
ncbi:hypothetical protein RDI58_010507 [Solanum bulbocastanum]|uniref:AIPP2-like SPOC-like domain-containing protein n=1 Tax=Solanum bulbocastanum TaxID=147425 RepID=A0AAN8YGU4_SOLBU